ncbi:MAG: electron transport complex subunit RsxD [Gammaproteobacteria bacterium]|nr:electron transport complex subunit RsxD [Gammaproteobacteria bacterium]
MLPLKTPSSPHAHAMSSVSIVMLKVIVALIPGIIASVYFFGWGTLINVVLAAATALLSEAFVLRLRGHAVMPALLDGSALVTALLLAVALPPIAPWWISVLGSLFAIVITKQLYGGLGYNPFNPAMAGYAFLLISFPAAMTTWLLPEVVSGVHLNLIESLRVIFLQKWPMELHVDAVSMATPLDLIKTQLGVHRTISEIRFGTSIIGDFGGKGIEWVGNWYLLGGLWLLYMRVITWHIPFLMLATLFAFSTLFSLYDPDVYSWPMFHIFSGGTLLCAFFIATDPVTAATTPRGRLIYGAGIGALIYIIRTWGGYPDAVAFAVLLMNIAAPTIDYYTQPRVYGYDK